MEIDVVDIILNILFVPLQVIMLPLDGLLSNIPGIGIIPSSINAIVGFVGSIPATIVKIMGVAPVLWNATITMFIAWLLASPAINLGKTIWAWLRP